MAHNPDWIDTPPLEFAIRGLDGSLLRFVLESRLNPAIAPVGLGLRLTAQFESWNVKLSAESSTDSDSDLRALRDALTSLAAGSEVSATFGGTGFSVTVARATVGVREGILVTGSMQMDFRCAPWLKPKQLPRYLLVDAPSAAALQFGFTTACIDPPLLEQTIRELNVIVQYLDELKLPEDARERGLKGRDN
jgi:hypothetical protein